MKVIGLTGGIGSGKSTVSQYLAELGAVVIDADKVGHEAYQPGTAAWNDVVAAFGRDIIADNGEIDRKKLGAMVFGNPEALRKLNSIMHPRMREMIAAQLEEYRRRGVDVVVIEAEVLITAGWTSLADELWVTVASEPTVLERVKKQRGLSGEEVLARIRSQMSSEERAKYADVIIENDGDLDQVKAEIKRLWQRLHG
ncbi:dephospho-CoA kinase [Chloroflexota bacterium]